MAPHERAAGVRTERSPSERGLRLSVPARQLADAPLAARISGAPVGATVVLQVRACWWSGERLVATARYVARDGTVDVSRDAPVAGYAGVEADGLLRSLVPVPDAAIPGGCHLGAWRASPLLHAGLADDLFEVSAWLDVPRSAIARSVTRRMAHDTEIATESRSVAGGSVTRFAQRRGRDQGLTVLAVPLVEPAGAARAAALLASHGHVVLLPSSAAVGTHLASVPGSLLGALEDASPGVGYRSDGRTVVLCLDLVPDRRSLVATRSWSDLLDRLRALRVAATPRR